MSSSHSLNMSATPDSTSFKQTQQLLGQYPFASATPSTHVARHLSNLSITAAPPSYIQPSHYSTPAQFGSMPMFQTELSHLSTRDIPHRGTERDFWDMSRNDVLRLMGDQSGTNYYPASMSHWSDAPSPSSHQPAPFAQSVMQHAVPYNAYPTPPPASITFSSSSSSLANALGTPSSRKAKHPESKSDNSDHNLSEPSRFFEEFLSDKIKGLPNVPQTKSILNIASPVSTPRVDQSSPDPLRMFNMASSPLTPLAPSQDSSRKRKLIEVLIETPSKHSSSNSRVLNARQSSPHTPRMSALPVSRKGDDANTPTRVPKMQVYVELPSPSKGWTTPSRSRTGDDVPSSDLGGYGPEDGKKYVPHRETMSNLRSTGKKTGDRDERAPLEKFLNLLEDIFEAEDNIAPDMDLGSLPSTYFSYLSADPARPLLHPTVIVKLTKAISKVARPTKRVRLASVQWESSTPGSPRKAGGMAEVEVQILSRLLKLLERSVRAGEDLDPFQSILSGKNARTNEIPTSPNKLGKAGLTQTKLVDGTDKHALSTDEIDLNSEAQSLDAATKITDLTDEDFREFKRALETARDSVLAADCCIALLTSDRLPKQLFSEELISSCLATIKIQLTKIIYPFVEAPASDSRDSSPLLMHIINRTSKESQLPSPVDYRRIIGDIFQALSAVFPRINNLVCVDSLAMTDSIIIPAVYIAIGPFFIVENGGDGDSKARKDGASLIISTTLGNSGMRGLRLEALSLVRSIFAYHEDQRSWIIEEILSSLIRLSDSKQKAGVFRLRDGRTIRTVSALLLQLVQTSSHSIRVEALRLAKSRQQQSALKRLDSTGYDVQEVFLDQSDKEEVSLYSSGLEAPTKAAKAIVVFLTQRSGKGKSTKNTNELEYRAIFDNLISDLLVVLFWPEWPAASLVLSIICKYMISSLDDVKSSSNDNNALKALALDHLGVIAGRLRSNILKWNNTHTNENSSSLKNLDEALLATDNQALERLISAHQEVSSHLSKRSTEDQACESARELSAVMWGQELAMSLAQLNDLMSDFDGDKGDAETLSINHRVFGDKLRSALRDVWKDPPTDVFDNATQDEIIRADNFAEQLGTTQSLRSAFDPILNVIILALDAPAVFVRTKALRALSQILTVDASILSNPNVRRAIETHLLDSSPQVRDAAVELIGRYMIDSPMVAGNYYHKIAERIADTGLGVRKRVIKLLKTYFFVTDDMDRKVDTCSKIVLRMLDEDDTVKDLAIKTIEELWFSSPSSTDGANRSSILAIVSVIMGVCSVFKDRQTPLEDMLGRIVSGKEGSDISAIRAHFTELYDAMIDGLVDASDYTNFTVVNCIRTLHLFTLAFPQVLSGSKALTMLPYLKNSTSAEEITASDYILKIYRISIPHMPKTSVKFGNDLQLILQPMVLKPTGHGTSLQETVACLCAVVQHLTHDFVRLVGLLKSCNARLQRYIDKKDNSLAPTDLRTLLILVFIVSLLGEHFEFDRLRTENAELMNMVNAVSNGPIVHHIYNCLIQLYDKYTSGNIRGRLLICLGFLFRAQPTLMTLESSAIMMDAIFTSSEDDNRGRLLKLMQEFLVSESSKYSIREKDSANNQLIQPNTSVDMEELVGNKDGFADSGVSSTIVQRYLNQILDSALSSVAHIQNSAVDILSFTIKQGLAHPLMSFPVIVALETSPNTSLSSRAVALHTILHHKHTSLLNSGFIPACRKSYDYQRKLFSLEHEDIGVRGYRMQPTPIALLGRWYALVREKRATRQEFLRAVLKVFELHDLNKTDEDAVHFVRYMAENFASFDYRTQEEVLTVLKSLTRELAETGALLVERIAPGNLLDQLRSTQEQGPNAMVSHEMPAPVSPVNRDLHTLPEEERLGLMRSSCIIGMIMLLKAHLKTVYGLSEEKCQKYVMGKKSAVGDRPASRRKDAAISWERMPHAMRHIRTTEDVEVQRTTFLEVWNEDGATAEPEGDEGE